MLLPTTKEKAQKLKENVSMYMEREQSADKAYKNGCEEVIGE